MVIDAYQDIMILEESGKVSYIGRTLLEDDDNTNDDEKKKAADGAINTIKDNTSNLPQDKINEAGKEMENADPKKLNTPTKILKWFGTRIMSILRYIWKSLINAIKRIGDWILEHVPGAKKVINKIRKIFGKEDEIVTFGGEELNWKQMITAGAASIILVGLLGYIIKKLTNRSAKTESIIINIQPLVLTESDDTIKDSFTKKVPGIFGKIIDFMKNVKDATAKFIITTIGIIIGVGFFMILGMLSRPAVCKALKFALGVDHEGLSDKIGGFDKGKYIAAKVTMGMANMFGDKTKTVLYDNCPCVSWKNKQYIWNDGNGCKEYLDTLKDKINNSAKK